MNTRGIPKWIIPIVLLVALCGGAYLLLGGIGRGIGGLFGGGDNIPQTGDLPEQPQNDLATGRVFVAETLDRAGCPQDFTTRFAADQVIFAGLDEGFIPAGTDLFARLYYEGRPLEDTDTIRAPEDIRGCVWFQFDPGRAGFDAGQYRVEVFAGGAGAGRATFEVLDSGGQANDERLQLGRTYAATGVDSAGCPAGGTGLFYPDEPVYVALEESSLPRGTELYARLNYEGRPIEDSQPIRADRDLQSCAWFVFEPGRGGFDPGQYSAEIFVNGQRADQVSFEVR